MNYVALFVYTPLLSGALGIGRRVYKYVTRPKEAFIFTKTSFVNTYASKKTPLEGRVGLPVILILTPHVHFGNTGMESKKDFDRMIQKIERFCSGLLAVAVATHPIWDFLKSCSKRQNQTICLQTAAADLLSFSGAPLAAFCFLVYHCNPLLPLCRMFYQDSYYEPRVKMLKNLYQTTANFILQNPKETSYSAQNFLHRREEVQSLLGKEFGIDRQDAEEIIAPLSNACKELIKSAASSELQEITIVP